MFMKIIYDIGKIKRKFVRPIAAIGVFDGLHRGHRYLIKKAVHEARLIRGTSVVMTFFPHPVHVLNPRADLPFLVPLPQRLKLIAGLKVDTCIVVRFTKRFSNLSPEDFVDKYLIQTLRPKEMFVGRGFRFGKDRRGDADFLKKNLRQINCKVNILAPLTCERKIVSSTRIRKFIAMGRLDEANQLLGRRVSIFGKVVSGDGRGRLLGFPTANIHTLRQCLPPVGVYLAQIIYKKKIWKGMANIGRRPSFKKDDNIHLEVHILDFHKNIYGKEIEVIFLRKIRDEKKFPSQGALIRQIRKDEKIARNFFKKFKASRSVSFA